MTSYFYTTKKGEVYELRMELNSERQDSEHDIFFLAYFDSVCRVFCSTIQGYSYDQRLENVDIDFNVPHTPIVGLGQ